MQRGDRVSMNQVMCENGHIVEAQNASSRFCAICGSAILLVCPNGHTLRPNAVFCRICGEQASRDNALPTITRSASPSDITSANPTPTIAPVQADLGRHQTNPARVGSLHNPLTGPAPQVPPAPRTRPINPFVWIGLGLAVLLGGGAVAISLSSSPSHSGTASTTQANVNGSDRTSPPIATTTPTTSASSLPTTEPGTPIPTVPLSSQGTNAMEVVQALASALAGHQWDQARTIYRLLESDSQLAVDYGALNASTVVITNESDSASSVELTGAYVAWETVNGTRQTSIYCIDWQVDPALQQVENQSAIASNQVGYQSKWVNPSALVPVVETQCVP